MEKFNKDHFDCPHCSIKNVTYTVEGAAEEDKKFPEDHPKFYRWGINHIVVRCNRDNCKRLTYFQTLKNYNTKGSGFEHADGEILFQYPPESFFEMPDYVPEKIRRYFLEAVRAYNFGLLDSASMMCRKTIYQLCDHRKATGEDYKEKIKNLGLDKRITDPLLNIKNIGDDSAHATGWPKETITKAIEALRIIIDMIYIQEERIKDFSKHYSQQKAQTTT